MTSETVTAAVAKRDNTPQAMLGQYKQDFATVLPSHLPVDKWVRVAQGLLRRDEKLAKAADRNPGSFLSATVGREHRTTVVPRGVFRRAG